MYPSEARAHRFIPAAFAPLAEGSCRPYSRRTRRTGWLTRRSFSHQNAVWLHASCGQEAELQGCRRCTGPDRQGRRGRRPLQRGWSHSRSSDVPEYGNAGIKWPSVYSGLCLILQHPAGHAETHSFCLLRAVCSRIRLCGLLLFLQAIDQQYEISSHSYVTRGEPEYDLDQRENYSPLLFHLPQYCS